MDWSQSSSLPAIETFSWVSQNCMTADAIWIDNLPCKPADVEWETVGFGPLAKCLAVRVQHWLTLQDQSAAKEFWRARHRSAWEGLVFGGVACNLQEKIHHHQEHANMDEACQALLGYWAALAASELCDVVTTSVNPESGTAGCLSKLSAM